MTIEARADRPGRTVTAQNLFRDRPVIPLTVLLAVLVVVIELADPGEDRVQRHLPAFLEGVRRVAPRAAQVAAGEPDDGAGRPHVRRFALNGREYLVDLEFHDAPPCRGGNPVSTRYICSTTSMPRRSRPSRMTAAVWSQSIRRLLSVASSGAFSTWQLS